MADGALSKYQPVIGLEVHIQLLTKSKLFARDANQFGDEPNTNISAITLAHPGTLPKINQKALELAIIMGLACGSEISQYLIFDRKNYFYPDLPKGFQLTQDRTPICVGGSITVTTSKGMRVIELNRIHLEEDAGKSFHPSHSKDSLVDFNRAGTPLIELVTEPVIHNSEEAFQLLSEIRKLVTFLNICDGNMEQGSLRCDCNVSVRLKGATELGKKVEIKNMNSVRNVRRAIEKEVQRQVSEIELGHEIISETRSFDEKSGGSSSMRTKEEVNDYRYFPEPDLSPVSISDQWIEKIRQSMPVLPAELKKQLEERYSFSSEDALFLTDSVETFNFFSAAVTHSSNPESILNWMKGPIQSYLKDQGFSVNELPLTPIQVSELADITASKISFSVAAQKILPELLKVPNSTPKAVAERLGLLEDHNEDHLEPIVLDILDSFPDKVAAYRKGKKGLIGFFMGQLMKKTESKVDPRIANELLSKHLN
ncbi:MAG: aspartyl/glutamyl-tRNA(Asn/Gln) amidotransferase subunit B [Cyclobacteriaceae bacterium]|nr:MAG: aspartyl/glutamyl-tRNA(Asn/Gln) amidotransferase subunit B [Cyclobacteriaceae bacterium]